MRLKRAKTSSRAKKPVRSSRAKKPTAASSASHVAGAAKARVIALGTFCAIVAVALLSAREDTPKTAADRELSAVSSTSEAVSSTSEIDTPRRRDAMKPEVVKASPAVEHHTAPASAPAVASDDGSAIARSAPADNRPPIDDDRSTTLTGCLENDEGVFRLTDVSGAEAPMSRSWKAGFLKKRPASIEVADGVGTLSLRSFVGRRVSTSGTLIDREMRANAVRAVGACE